MDSCVFYFYLFIKLTGKGHSLDLAVILLGKGIPKRVLSSAANYDPPNS